MKTTIWTAFFAVAATCAFAEVPPVRTAEPVAQKWGEEADDEVQREGVLFWRDDKGALYIGDGETPGGKAVCVGLPPDLYSWTNDVSANGHALLWGGGWSQQSEGGSLLVRLGTNSWLRFVAADAGTLANLAVSDLDQANGTMRLTADTADPGAVLLVATNLLDPEAWQPATNGEIVASTDASTTWLITLLDTPFEVYRVRTSVTLEAGIHAERTLHANAGIEMAGERWDAWPTNHATTADLNTASNALSGRFADYLPLIGGNVTGDIILGTNSTTPAIEFRRMLPNDGNLDFKIFANGAGLMIYDKGSGNWVNRFQFLPNAGFAHGTSVSAGYYATAEGESASAKGQDSYASGYYVSATGFAARATGGQNTAGASYAEATGYGCVASNWGSHVWSGVNSTSPKYGSHGNGSWNINPAGGITNMWVGAMNMASHITSLALPLTGGVIRGNLIVTNTSDAVGGRFAHGKGAVASGAYATAEGENATASGMYSYASGKNVTASGYGGRVVGANSKATQSWAASAGLNAEATHERSYVWNADSAHTYRSNGNGTWSINPEGGTDGFFIGQSNLTQIINAAVAAWMEANGY